VTFGVFFSSSRVLSRFANHPTTISQAIHRLQLAAMGAPRPRSVSSKDSAINALHAVGKLLNAKRIDGVLSFSPESTLARSGFDSAPDTFVEMVHANYLSFFSHVGGRCDDPSCLSCPPSVADLDDASMAHENSDVSTFLNALSMGDILESGMKQWPAKKFMPCNLTPLLFHPSTGTANVISGAVAPEARRRAAPYTGSLCVRAATLYNRHPAPSSFRPIVGSSWLKLRRARELASSEIRAQSLRGLIDGSHENVSLSPFPLPNHFV
jgi:hypothetical protein